MSQENPNGWDNSLSSWGNSVAPQAPDPITPQTPFINQDGTITMGGYNSGVPYVPAIPDTTPGTASTVTIPQAPDNSSYVQAVPNTPNQNMAAMDAGQIGNIGPGDQTNSNAFGVEGANYASAQDSSAIGDTMAFHDTAQGGFSNISGIVGSDTATAINKDLGGQVGTNATTGAASDTSGAGKPVNITDISNAGQAAGNVIGQNVSQAGNTIAGQINKTEQAAIQSNSGLVSSIENNLTDLMVRFGMVLLALVLLFGAWQFFKVEGGQHAPA